MRRDKPDRYSRPLTWCFPFSWHKCESCAQEFKFEFGIKFSMSSRNWVYVCGKCCGADKDAHHRTAIILSRDILAGKPPPSPAPPKKIRDSFWTGK